MLQYDKKRFYQDYHISRNYVNPLILFLRATRIFYLQGNKSIRGRVICKHLAVRCRRWEKFAQRIKEPIFFLPDEQKVDNNGESFCSFLFVSLSPFIRDRTDFWKKPYFFNITYRETIHFTTSRFPRACDGYWTEIKGSEQKIRLNILQRNRYNFRERIWKKNFFVKRVFMIIKPTSVIHVAVGWKNFFSPLF